MPKILTKLKIYGIWDNGIRHHFQILTNIEASKVRNFAEYNLLHSILLPSRDLLSKVNDGNTKTMCEIFSKLTIKTPERFYRLCFGVFIVNSVQISRVVLVFLLFTLNKLIPAGL